jgi:predicted lipoprotein with Yx(FWY)xxD motif
MTTPFAQLRPCSRLPIALAVTAAAVVVAACGSTAGGTGPDGSASSRAPAVRASAAGGAALALRHTALGTILTTGQGFTVYAFEADHATTSACVGACAAAWPPVTTSSTRITVVGGATKSLVGEITRPGGVHQLTYAGHPLYTFAGDSSPGVTNGQGYEAFGARWDMLTPAGQEITGG